LSAFTAAKAFGISNEAIKKSLGKATAAFGRTEKLIFGKKEVYLFLTKNPTGMSQVIETLGLDDHKKDFLICLNDNYADGVDVSWIWDADIESLKSNSKSVICSGIRARDMALRLKYAGYDHRHIEVNERIVSAFTSAVRKLENNEALYVLATYTAMLELRKYLTKKGMVQAFWRTSS
jgi:lipid II isoglutaminyl synthase (glutamine-hydrolysing)